MTAFLQIDAFTTEPFGGNPAAVCVLDEAADANWMQAVASEMNLSETAFLSPQGDGWRLRWFTPVAEVALCGHATLASAHALVTAHDCDGSELRFHTLSGLLTASVANDGAITLDFPADDPSPCRPPDGLLGALGVDAVAVAKGRTDYLVELEDHAAVERVRPAISALGAVDARGVMVTAAHRDPDVAFVSRFFAPRVGVPEDPVTGSAHTTLAPWWANRLGATSMRAEQASSRGGRLEVTVAGDRVLITGHAVTVARGELLGSAATSATDVAS